MALAWQLPVVKAVASIIVCPLRCLKCVRVDRKPKGLCRGVDGRIHKLICDAVQEFAAVSV